ncbi:queuosine salvage family protein [Paenibacillus motobuensis]|uniref:Queuosine 5'-phosphate N-glycosylase/hydrolase n=1 Tax=Paenibacillus motobuensis TaxID=295324 RepID=A0ABP3HWM0_9BACL
MEIKIVEERINFFAGKLSEINHKFHQWKDEFYLDSNNIEEIALFFFIGNSINYRFWYSSARQRFIYGKFTGSAAMWAFLKDNKNLIKPQYLALNKINENQPGLLDLPMSSERINSLSEAGRVLLNNFSGSALKICEKAEWHAPTIVDIITEQFPMWRDEQRNVKFNKRAQLFVAMLHGRLGKESKIRDIDKLSCLADYQLPKVLRHIGILKYSKELEDMVDSETLISKDSDYEFNIRLNTVESMKLLCEELRNFNINVSPLQLDYALWLQAKEISTPHHLTPTTAY